MQPLGHYRIVENSSDDDDVPILYGIAGSSVMIEGITDDIGFIKQLVHELNETRTEECHLRDIVKDELLKRYFSLTDNF